MQNRIINRVANGNGKTLFDAELFGFFSDDFVRAVGEGRAKVVGLADTTFTYGARDDAFITSMETNVFHFSAAKTLAELQELNSLFRESGSFEEFHKKALQTTDVFNKRWQQTEYETAVLTAESASNYQRLVGKTRLFPYWEYKTAGGRQGEGGTPETGRSGPSGQRSEVGQDIPAERLEMPLLRGSPYGTRGGRRGPGSGTSPLRGFF